MNIVISSKRFRPILGGTVRYAEMLAKGFRQLGHEVRIMTRTPASEPEVREDAMIIRRASAREALELAAWADILLQVDASWRDAWPFILKGCPWFTTVHFGKRPGKYPLSEIFGLPGLAAAFILSRTIPISKQVAKDWNLTEEPIANPFDDSIFHPPLTEDRDTELLFVGRLERSKGIFVLLDALSKLKGDLPQGFRCAVIGEGRDKDGFEERASKSGIDFLHLGRLEPEEVAGWMRRSRLLVFPTTPEWIEASPLTPLEAVACGCKVIASDNGGTRENIGPSGTLVTSGSVDSLAAALQQHFLQKKTCCSASERDAEFLAPKKIIPTCALYLERFATAARR